MHMDTPAKAALGGGLISTLAIGGMVAAGVLATSATVVLTDPTAPPAGAAGLVPFDDCDSLLDWYVDHSLDEVGPWGWGGRMWPMMAEGQAARESVGSSTADDAVSNGPTGTNTQEAGIDEPDVAKTDGRIVVRLRDGHRLVVTDVTGDEPRELADWRLPGAAYADGLLLVDDHVLLGASNQVMGREGFMPPDSGGTVLYDVDLSDPADPRLEDTDRWSGRQLSMRQYGDTVRLVTTLGLPSLPFVQPGGALSETAAEQRNRQVVRASKIEDWAPGLDCSEVYHPQKWSGPDTVAVTTFRPASSDRATRVAVTGAGSEVYSSVDRLYVTSTDWNLRPIPLDGGPDTTVRSDVIRPDQKIRTHIHSFAISGSDTRYAASGVVEGRCGTGGRWTSTTGTCASPSPGPRGRGARARTGSWSWTRQRRPSEQVGELAGQPRRGHQSRPDGSKRPRGRGDVRQMGICCTRIDLTDPDASGPLGEAKIPGFSAYLHPIGDDRTPGAAAMLTPTVRTWGPGCCVRHSETARARQADKLDVRIQRFEARGSARVHVASGRARGHCRDVSRNGLGPSPAAGRLRRIRPRASFPRSAVTPSGRCPSRTVGWPSSATRSVSSRSRPLIEPSPGSEARAENQPRRTLVRMCRNIRTLHNFEPPATRDEVHAAAVQYVRKISGSTKPSQANQHAFDHAIAEVEAATRRLLEGLSTTAPPKDRDVEAAKARARAEVRYARG